MIWSEKDKYEKLLQNILFTVRDWSPAKFRSMYTTGATPKISAQPCKCILHMRMTKQWKRCRLLSLSECMSSTDKHGETDDGVSVHLTNTDKSYKRCSVVTCNSFSTYWMKQFLTNNLTYKCRQIFIALCYSVSPENMSHVYVAAQCLYTSKGQKAYKLFVGKCRTCSHKPSKITQQTGVNVPKYLHATQDHSRLRRSQGGSSQEQHPENGNSASRRNRHNNNGVTTSMAHHETTSKGPAFLNDTLFSLLKSLFSPVDYPENTAHPHGDLTTNSKHLSTEEELKLNKTLVANTAAYSTNTAQMTSALPPRTDGHASTRTTTTSSTTITATLKAVTTVQTVLKDQTTNNTEILYSSIGAIASNRNVVYPRITTSRPINTLRSAVSTSTLSTSRVITVTNVTTSQATTANDVTTLTTTTAGNVAKIATMTGNDLTTITRVGNDVTTLATMTENDAATLTAMTANDATTLTTMTANDAVTLTPMTDNDATTLTTMTVNNATTLTPMASNGVAPLTPMIHNHVAAISTMTTNDDSTLATITANDAATLATMAANDATTLAAMTANDATTLATMAANDATTLAAMPVNDVSAAATTAGNDGTQFTARNITTLTAVSTNSFTLSTIITAYGVSTLESTTRNTPKPSDTVRPDTVSMITNTTRNTTTSSTVRTNGVSTPTMVVAAAHTTSADDTTGHITSPRVVDNITTLAVDTQCNQEHLHGETTNNTNDQLMVACEAALDNFHKMAVAGTHFKSAETLTNYFQVLDTLLSTSLKTASLRQFKKLDNVISTVGSFIDDVVHSTTGAIFHTTVKMKLNNVDLLMFKSKPEVFKGRRLNLGTVEITVYEIHDIVNMNSSATPLVTALVLQVPDSQVSLGNPAAASNARLSSPVLILAASVDGIKVSLSHSFSMNISYPKNVSIEPVCAFQTQNYSIWDSSGCQLSSVTDDISTTEKSQIQDINETFTSQNVVCRCNHTTNFAVLMQVVDFKIQQVDELALSIITYIGCSVTLITQVISITVFTCVRSLNSERICVHRNLCISIMAAQITFISGVKAVQDKVVCAIVAVFLHYFHTSSFMWMLVEGIHLYNMIVKVFGTERSRIVYYTCIGFGLPLLLVSISAAVDWEGYGTKYSCWLSIQRSTIWAFVGPALAIMIVNIVILSIVIQIVVTSAKIDTNSDYNHIRAGIKATLVLLPLLGLTWIFGLMAVNEKVIVFQYIFAILNTLQGFFIFMLHCVFNTEVRQTLNRLRQKRLLQKTEFLNTISTNDRSVSSPSSSSSISDSRSSKKAHATIRETLSSAVKRRSIQVYPVSTIDILTEKQRAVVWGSHQITGKFLPDVERP